MERRNIGQKIILARKDAKLTQTKLAEKIKRTRQTVNAWENETSSPTLTDILNISKATDKSFDYFSQPSNKNDDTKQLVNTEDMEFLKTKIQTLEKKIDALLWKLDIMENNYKN
ncbi:transcriptional regulator with XRE-family HTH domain [Elusimicrobium posterum]|uniref:helix-turn-helix transcriptional regulator n=1 Tax=Elusimicrobium posterum TaxID=3116653 RepID=UPI003C74A58A